MFAYPLITALMITVIKFSFAVWDSPLRYRLLIYTHDGHLDFDYCAYQHQLGVKTGQLLIVGSHDGKIRVLNTLCWSVVHEIEHYPALHEREPVTRHVYFSVRIAFVCKL